jgi:hypothetical protein
VVKKVLLFLSLAAISVFAQSPSTHVTATITDSQGVAWASAAYTFNLDPNPPTTGRPLTSNNQFFPLSYSGTADATGAFALDVQDTGFIQPKVYKWKVCVTPAVSAPITYCASMAIESSSQNISSQIAAVIQPPALTGGVGVTAYADSEVAAKAGNTYFRLSDSSFRCYIAAWGACGSSNVPISAPSASVHNVLFNDSFNYPDGTSIGGQVAPTGQTWAVTGGLFANALVQSHYLTISPPAVGVYYAYVTNLAANPYTVTETFKFQQGDSTCTVPTLAIIGDQTSITNKMIHAVLSCIGADVTWWNGASQNNQPAYKSSTTGNWTSGITLSANTTYTITLGWDGGNNVWVVGPDGGVLNFSDSNFAVVGGKGFFVEEGTSNTADYPQVSNVTVTQQTSSISGDLIAASNLQGTIGLPSLSPGYFTQVGIGTQSPGAPLQISAYPGFLAPSAIVDVANTHAKVYIRADTFGYGAGIYLNMAEGDGITGLEDQGGFAGLRMIFSGVQLFNCAYSTWVCTFGNQAVFSGGAVLSGGVLMPNQTPASSSAACTQWQMVVDANFVYVCTATNTWKRAAITTW